jgi:hypothetical protein
MAILCWAAKNSLRGTGYFLSMSQQAVSADIISNSVVGIFPPKQKEQRHRQPGYTDKLVTAQIKKFKNSRST